MTIENLMKKIHVEDKHKQNADSSETVGYQSQSSASHRSTEKEIWLLMTMIN